MTIHKVTVSSTKFPEIMAMTAYTDSNIDEHEGHINPTAKELQQFKERLVKIHDTSIDEHIQELKNKLAQIS
jgi:hypothetical protein